MASSLLIVFILLPGIMLLELEKNCSYSARTSYTAGAGKFRELWPALQKESISKGIKHLRPKLQSSKFLLICCHTLEVPKLRRRQLFTLKFPRLLKFCWGQVQKCLSCHGTELAHTPAPSDPMNSAFLHLHPSCPRGRASEHSQNTESCCSAKCSGSSCCSPLPHSRAPWSGLLP